MLRPSLAPFSRGYPHRTALLVALFFSSAWTQVASAQDRAPVLLRKTALLQPIESVGTGLEPEVRVRVKIDRRGAVEAVEVLGIQPSSELDEAFAAHTRDELTTWRYAPALENGEPVAKTLDWTVKYQAGSDLGTTDQDPAKRFMPSLMQPPSKGAAWELTQRRELFQVMDPTRKQEILQGYSRIAEKYLVAKDRKQHASAHFIVVSDFAAEELPRQVANNLEAAFQTIDAFHQPEIEPYPHGFKTLVYLYSTRNAFQTMRSELSPYTQEWATYYPPGLIVFHLEVSSDYLLGFLIHEASHAYSDQHLRRFPIPLWFEEGFAEYMGNSRVKKGRLVPGETLKRRYVLNHGSSGGARMSTTDAGWDLDHVRRAIRGGETPSLVELLDTDRNTFYGAESSLYYGLSWLFVHFLRHGAEGHEELFSRLVLYMAEGYPARFALESIYGRDVPSMEEDFKRYVKKQL